MYIGMHVVDRVDILQIGMVCWLEGQFAECGILISNIKNEVILLTGSIFAEYCLQIMRLQYRNTFWLFLGDFYKIWEDSAVTSLNMLGIFNS